MGSRVDSISLIDVRFSHGTRDERIGLVVVDEPFGRRVEREVSLQPHADVGGMNGRHAVMHNLGIGDRLFATSYAVDEILHMIERSAGAGDIFADNAFELAQQCGR